MSQYANSAHYVASVSTATHSFALTLGTGTNRKVTIAVIHHATSITSSAVAFNGQAATLRHERNFNNTYNSGGIAFYTYDVPDALAAGSYNVTFTTSSASTAFAAKAWQTVGSVLGAPEDSDFDDGTGGTDTAVTLGLTSSAGAFIAAAAWIAAVAPTITWSGDVTERDEEDGSNFTTGSADGEQASGGTKTVTATGSAATGNKVLVAISIAAVSADTPPTAGLSASVVGNRVTVTDESVAGTNPITSVEYDYYDGEAGLEGDWTTATTHEYDPDTERGAHTIRQRVNDGVTDQQEATEAIVTESRYIYDAVTVGGRSASSNIVDIPDA